MNFEGPIPGESLTAAPNTYNWERPPETVDEEEAIVHHIERLSNPEVQDNVLDALQMGLPVSYITDLALTGGVVNGIHNIDMSLIIAPAIHEYIMSIADASGMDYKEFFDKDSQESDALIKEQATKGLSKAIDIADNDDSGVEYLRELEAAIPETEPTVTEEKPKSKGLMAREEELE